MPDAFPSHSDHTQLSTLESRKFTHVRVLIMLAVLAAASLTALTGNGRMLPLEAHEVFVARTAEEMLARGDYVVPYLNNEPRLRKPPLAYWLTMAADFANDCDGSISEWEARVPSIVSGVALAGLAAFLGMAMFGDKTGLIAGLLTAACGGYVHYSHNARPEMLYAACCTAGIAGLSLSFFPPAQRGLLFRACSAWFAWVMFGLAMLAKGPQLPLLILLGFTVFGVRDRGWRDTLRSLRLFSGLIVFAAVSGWWFVAMMRLNPQSDDTWTGETLLRIFQNDGDRLRRYLNPYYLYRTAGLLLPWVVLYPLALAMPLFPFMKRSASARMLWWVLIVPLVLLHISLGRRWYYMLPLLAPMNVLIAWGAVQVGYLLGARGLAWVWRIACIAHIVALLLATAWMQQRSAIELLPPAWAPWLMLIAATVAFIVVIRNPLNTHRAVAHSLVALMTFGIVFFIAATANASLWRSDRYEDRRFSFAVGREVSSIDILIGWEADWEAVQFYNHRFIPSPDEIEELHDVIGRSFGTPDRSGRVLLLVNLSKPIELPPGYEHRVVLESDPTAGENHLQLWQIIGPNQAP